MLRFMIASCIITATTCTVAAARTGDAVYANNLLTAENDVSKVDQSRLRWKSHDGAYARASEE